jgi:hypothetical protein
MTSPWASLRQSAVVYRKKCRVRRDFCGSLYCNPAAHRINALQPRPLVRCTSWKHTGNDSIVTKASSIHIISINHTRRPEAVPVFHRSYDRTLCDCRQANIHSVGSSSSAPRIPSPAVMRLLLSLGPYYSPQ